MELIGQSDFYTTIDDLDAANITALLERAIAQNAATKQVLAKRKEQFQSVYDDATQRVLAAINAPAG